MFLGIIENLLYKGLIFSCTKHRCGIYRIQLFKYKTADFRVGCNSAYEKHKLGNIRGLIGGRGLYGFQEQAVNQGTQQL